MHNLNYFSLEKNFKNFHSKLLTRKNPNPLKIMTNLDIG